VVRQYGWSPHEIGRLMLDDADYLGLLYWYKDALEIEKAMKKK
jgi:hypothetical protein